MFGLRVEVDIYEPEIVTFGNRIASDDESRSIPGATKRSMTIIREGIGRTYRVELPGRCDPVTQHPLTKTFFWKGTKSALSLVEDQVHNNNGNLKFIPAENPSSILAAWQSRTDKLVVGSLSVIESFDEGEQGMLEEVITSCLAVVLAERITGRGWLGGLGRSRGRREDGESKAGWNSQIFFTFIILLFVKHSLSLTQ